MRPSLPASWFDVCLVPRHDLAKRRAGGNVIATVGALNRIVPAAGPRQPNGVFLIGGPAPADLPGLVEALATIAAAAPQLAWTLTDSRRTPTEFLPSLRPLGLPLEVYGHATTPGDWLPQQLASASDVWVTPDSVSMIHEALTSGARVGLLPCPQTLSAPRLSASVAQLVAAGWLAPYDAWLATRRLPEPPAPLAEAQRCAPRVLEHLRGRRKVPLTGKR
jgi:mitochondrial fission protein ELM1